VDILLDRPFAYAPWTPKDPKENEHAAYANAMPGKRGGCQQSCFALARSSRAR